MRKTERPSKDGVPYVQHTHNRRVDGTNQAEVRVHFDRQDSLDVKGLRR